MARVSLKRELQGRILDLGGGGEGVIDRVYREQVVAIDTRQDELDEAPEGPEKRVMDARALTFPDGAFDHVTAFYFFMYLPRKHRADAVREAYRALRPGGRLHVWDADIAEACLFCVELDIDAAGTSVHTIYGVYREDAAQDARTVAAAAVAAGFRLLDWRTEAGQFALRFEK